MQRDKVSTFKKGKTIKMPMTYNIGMQKIPTDIGKYKVKLLYKIKEICLGMKSCQYWEKYESEHEQRVSRRTRGWLISRRVLQQRQR